MDRQNIPEGWEATTRTSWWRRVTPQGATPSIHLEVGPAPHRSAGRWQYIVRLNTQAVLREVVDTAEGAMRQADRHATALANSKTGVCTNCGHPITTWHPYPRRLPEEWTHARDGSWECPGGSGRHAEPKED